MHKYLFKAKGIMKNQRNMTPSKEYSKPPVTGPKEMEIQEFLDREFKKIVLKMLKRATREHR